MSDEIETMESAGVSTALSPTAPLNVTYARYLGEGVRYLAGIPARDLTRDEWEALGEDEQKRALDVKPALYEIVETRKRK